MECKAGSKLEIKCLKSKSSNWHLLLRVVRARWSCLKAVLHVLAASKAPHELSIHITLLVLLLLLLPCALLHGRESKAGTVRSEP